MPPRYYLDTSVFGGVFDAEFETESVRIFEMVMSGEITCVLSEITEGELIDAPNDCLHIAIATVSEADVLVSWNFKHIVNAQRIRGYNCINLRLGYKELEIVSPKTVLKP